MRDPWPEMLKVIRQACCDACLNMTSHQPELDTALTDEQETALKAQITQIFDRANNECEQKMLRNVVRIIGGMCLEQPGRQIEISDKAMAMIGPGDMLQRLENDARRTVTFKLILKGESPFPGWPITIPEQPHKWHLPIRDERIEP